MTIFLALIIGGLFGFVLDRIGATNPTVLGRMLALINMGLMKAILLAIGVGSVLMFAGQMVGLVDVGHMSVKTAYIGVFVGGLLLGTGWAIGGYCPGTGLAGVMRCISSAAASWARRLTWSPIPRSRPWDCWRKSPVARSRSAPFRALIMPA